MSFQESACSVTARLHASHLNIPLLVALTALLLVGLGYVGYTAYQSIAAPSLSFTPAAAQETEQAVPKTLWVHVSGCVASPGVYEVEQGKRVNDAIAAAGGFTEGAATDGLNLARAVADGEHVIVPSADAAPADAPVAASAASGAVGGLVDVNHADQTQLETLPGIGAATAKKIIADREANGPFASPEDLKRVSGIGDAKYAALADLICAG